MAISKKDEFLFYDWNDACIVIEDHKIDEYIEYINSNNIKSIGINSFHYKIDNLDFMRECTNVEEVNIISPLINDFNGLTMLKSLLKLTVNEHEGGEIDLSRFGKLEFFMGEYSKYLKGIDKTTSLKILSLSKYKSKNKNLQEFSELLNLEKLQLVQSQISSLKGIENLKGLEEFEIYSAPKLERLDSLEELSQNLKTLKFECCKKIKNHEYVTCLRELEILAFNNCGEIPSIDFVREMPKLKQFMFVDTNVVDGDLSPCMDLEYSGFFDKKHYSHKFKDLNDKKYWK